MTAVRCEDFETRKKSSEFFFFSILFPQTTNCLNVFQFTSDSGYMETMKCGICGLPVRTKSQLAVHRYRHKPENRRKHSCPLCGCGFRDVTMLRRHFQTLRHELRQYR